MASKKKILKVSAIVFIVVLLIALVTLNYIIPLVIKSIILPTVEKQLGAKKLNCDIRRIGISGADLGSVSIQGEGRSALSIKSIQVNYSLTDILRGRVGTMTLSGITLSAEIKDGNFIISGLDYKKFLAETDSTGQKKNTAKNKSPTTPLLMRELQVSNLTLIVRHGTRKFTMPVSFKLTAPENSMNELNCVLTIWPRDHKVALNVDLSMKKKELAFKINTVDVINLARFQDLAEYLPGLVLSGKLAIDAEGVINSESFSIKKLASKISLDDSLLRYSGIEFCNAQDNAGKNIPASIVITGADNNIDIGIKELSFGKPLPFAVNPVNVKIALSDGKLSFRGVYRLTLAPKNLPVNNDSPVRIMKPVDLDGVIAGDFSRGGEWTLKFADEPGLAKNDVRKKRISTELNGATNFSMLLPVYEFEAAGTGATKGVVKFRLKAHDVLFKDKDFSAALPLTDIKSSTEFLMENGRTAVNGATSISTVNTSADYANAKIAIKEFISSLMIGGDMKIELRSTISSLTASQGTMLFTAPEIVLNAGTSIDSIGLKAIDSKFKLKDLSFSDSASSFNVSGINASMPLKWPCNEIYSGGTLRVEKIGFGGLDSATIDMNIAQKETSLLSDGKLAFEPLGATCLFNVSGGMNNGRLNADLKFNMPETTIAEPVNMASIHPAAKNIFLNGTCGFSGAFAYEPTSGTKSSMDLKVKDTRIELKNNNFILDKVSMDLKLTDLLKFKSEPKQNIAFGSAALGNILMKDGKVEYQIESLKSVFVEKGSLKWCGGNVYTHAMRFAPGINDYTMTLYCDHINLARMLGQLGAAQAEGSGSLNGKVPLRFVDGKLTFEEGFFFSIPGEGGSIHLTKSDVLASSIAQSEAPVELELAQAALGDFKYEWAKITLTTEGENLLMNLNLDGKPAEILPFVYDREEGRFVKIKANVAGSKFQGIRLDVNFRLPINRILEYSKGTKNVLDNFK